MNHPVVLSLFPVVLLIAIGWLAGRKRWIGTASVKDLSNLVFVVLTPALLFRTMSTVHVEQLDFTPVIAYFAGVVVIFAATLLVGGFNRRAAVLALANTFSNTVMIGIPLVGIAFGQDGLVVLLTLYTVHTVLLLTSATVVLELAVMREDRATGAATERHMAMTVLLAIRNAIIHPVPLPVILGMLFAQTGLTIPAIIDKPLQLLGNAFGPLALVLVGVTLAFTQVGAHIRGAFVLAVVKNLVHPALVAATGLALGLSGLPIAVMVVTSSLPIGANVFLFSQRYKVAEELITASVVVSTLLALASVPLVMWAATRL
ncbi:MAG: AEC family transporter [Comamonadaceae bacterium]|nr:MAG: AEC family transporter [Comamonadaceae bacterium]